MLFYVIHGAALVHIHVVRLRFMKRLFWKAIHHLLGLLEPSAYKRSTKRAASSWRTWVKYVRRNSRGGVGFRDPSDRVRITYLHRSYSLVAHNEHSMGS